MNASECKFLCPNCGIDVIASVPSRTKSKKTWDEEKQELMMNHQESFIAYRDGKRIALEFSIDQLVAALGEKTGKPHKSCEFHKIMSNQQQSPDNSEHLLNCLLEQIYYQIG